MVMMMRPVSGSGLAPATQQFHDVEPDARGNVAAAARRRMRGVPFDALRARRFGRHAMGPVPFLVDGHGPTSFARYIALTMFSVTFLASPSSIMVLSR
jgi:hypothetical protein